MSYSDQMINQNPIVSARAALQFHYPDTASAQVFALLAIAEHLETLVSHHVDWPTVDAMLGDPRQPDWPNGGYSPDGNSWICPEPNCGYGIAGLNAPADEDDPYGDGDPVTEHIEEHRRRAEREWHSAQVIKIKISDRYFTYLIRDELAEGYRASDGSFHTIDSITEAGNQVTVVEP